MNFLPKELLESLIVGWDSAKAAVLADWFEEVGLPGHAAKLRKKIVAYADIKELAQVAGLDCPRRGIVSDAQWRKGRSTCGVLGSPHPWRTLRAPCLLEKGHTGDHRNYTGKWGNRLKRK